MKKLVIVLCVILMASMAYAGRWCEWSGTEGENCVNDRNGVLLSPTGVKTRTISKINSWGLYQVTTTQPQLGVNQVRDAEIWDKVGNQISLTWSVRDMTEEEIYERDAQPMSVEVYLLYKALVAGGVFTQQQVVTYLTNNYPEIVTAYLARKALEELE